MTIPVIIAELHKVPIDLLTARLPASRGGVPPELGLYAWWVRQDSLPDIPSHPHPVDPRLDLLYLGIAPQAGSSRATLRSRVCHQHLNGNIEGSTLRRSLAALLRDPLSLQPYRRGRKIRLSPLDEAQLTKWQDEHLCLTWAVHPQPWTVEAQLIAALAPPMNLEHNAVHAFYATMKLARAAFQSHAGEFPP